MEMPRTFSVGSIHARASSAAVTNWGWEDRLDAVEGYEGDHLDRGARDALGVAGKDGLFPLRDVVAEPYEEGYQQHRRGDRCQDA